MNPLLGAARARGGCRDSLLERGEHLRDLLLTIGWRTRWPIAPTGPPGDSAVRLQAIDGPSRRPWTNDPAQTAPGGSSKPSSVSEEAAGGDSAEP